MWLAIAFILVLLAVDPSLEAAIVKEIQDFSGAAIGGAAGTATKWWIIGSVAATGLGIISWLIIDSISTHRGEGHVAAPAIGAVGAAPPPRVTGETKIDAGPVSVGGGVSRTRATVLGGL